MKLIKIYFTIGFLLVSSILLNSCSNSSKVSFSYCGSPEYHPKKIDTTRIELIGLEISNKDNLIILPQILGGVDAFIKKISYPQKAIHAGIEGRVWVLFTIDSTGNVINASMAKGLDTECDFNVISAVKSQKFIPAKKNGIPIKQTMSIGVNFIIDYKD